MLKLIFFGGLDGIGKNMLGLEYEEEIIILDCGIMFPEYDMHGIDKVIPDFNYLVENKQKVKAVFISHGHEDHIGAIAFFMEKINVPIYGTALSLGLVEQKLLDRGIRHYELKKVNEESRIELNHFKVSFLRVSHSIPDGVMTIIEAPPGRIVHSGDFKIDFTPVDNITMDLSKVAQLGKEGVLLFMSDSTNAMKKGHTLSERQVGESFDRVFKNIKGRILLATFSSNIHRVQQAIDSAKKLGRKITFAGVSMENTAKIARKLGYLNYEDHDVVFIGEVDRFADNEMLILTTGSQGEPLSALTRITNDNYRLYQIKETDTVIISALPIPGNEKMVYSTIDKLGRKGIKVIYEEASKLHVSGHAYAEELKLMLVLLKPRFFIPVHGEFRHLYAHSELARELGDIEDIIIAENGHVLEIDRSRIRIKSKLALRDIYIDGNDTLLEDEGLLDERRNMANEGAVVVVFITDPGRRIIYDIQIMSKGVMDTPEDFVRGLKDSLSDRYNNISDKTEEGIKRELEDMVERYIFKKTGKSPCIIPIIVER